MIQRMLAAARLDVDFFEDVESDMSLTGQAMLVVLIASIAGGIGAIGGEGIGAFFLGVIAWIVFWAVMAFVTYFVGTTIFNTPQTYANWGQMARVIGYAQSPGILRIFGFIPGLGGGIILIALVWQIAATIVGVRQALDYESTWRAVGVVIVSVIPALVISFIIMLPIGAFALFF